MTQEVLREESQIHTQEELEEVSLPMMLRILTPSLFANPEIECSKDPENGTHTQYIMEVSYYVVGVMLCHVNPPVREYNPCKSSNGEQYQEPQCKQHGSSQPQRTTVKSSQPAENFNTSRYCNNHSSTSEVSTSVYIQPYRVHVVPPNQESKQRNGSHCVYHPNVPEYWLTCKEAQYVAYNTECGLYLHVYLRVPKEPEEVLVQNNISSTCGLEEGSVEVTVSQKHSQSSSEYWKTSNQLDANKAKGPYKQRYTVKGHSLSTHVCNGHQEVHTSLDTSDTRNVLPKNSLVYGCSRVALSTTERRIRSPPDTGSLFYQSTQLQQSQSPRQHPEGDVVHSRKCHIGRPDHYGN